MLLRASDFFGLISLILACVSLWMLAVGLRKFEALYMITVFEGFMIVSGSISGNVVLDEAHGQSTERMCAPPPRDATLLMLTSCRARGPHSRPRDAPYASGAR